jgi:hypothetical protein
MSIEFDIGKQVVCVRDDWVNCGWFDERIPYKGEILTIREIGPPCALSSLPADQICFRFVEIVNPPRPTGELQFYSGAFRPVRKTNISVFEKHLLPVTDEVTA